MRCSLGGLVGGDHLAVDYRFVDIEHGRHLVAERLEAAQNVAVARDEAATALLDVAQRSKPIVFEVEEPFRVIERLLSSRSRRSLGVGTSRAVSGTPNSARGGWQNASNPLIRNRRFSAQLGKNRSKINASS